jgi:plastocyanin
MRKLLVVLVIAVLSAVLATQAFARTRTVKVGDDYFLHRGSPPTITIKKGQRVRWKWVGHNSHNVSVTKGPKKFSSSFQREGTFRHKFSKAGTYKIVCVIHQPDMAMTIKVKR